MQLFPALPEVVQGTFRPAPFGRLERRDGSPCERGIFIVDHTTNYQLSQWETTDRILMSDFNSDNSKIDAALKANADAIAALDTQLDAKADQADLTALANRSRFTKLGEVNISADTSPVVINLSGIDWTQWDKVHLDMLISNQGSRMMYYNTSDRQNYFYTIGSDNPTASRMPRMTFDVGFSADRTVSFNLPSEYEGPYLSYAQLTQILIVGGVYSGPQIFVWGEK